MKKSGRKVDRTRYPLPVPVDDASRICVKLWIPNIEGHRQAFLGAVYNLTRWYAWAQDENQTALATAKVWQPVFYDLLEHFYDGCEEEDRCFEFPPSASFIEWFPNNPYTEPDLITDGYNAPAWYEATAASNLILGTQFGDIVTDLSRFPPGSLPSIIPASGLPRFRINLVAPGIITIHLLNIFAGSVAQITIDDDVGTVRFIDMDRDQIAIPFETATTTPVEVEVLGAGAHHIDVIVVSQINDAIPFLHHGGGLRKIEICGEAADMPFYELRTNPDDPCLIEQRQLASGEWFEAFRMDNCCEDNVYTRFNDEGIMETSTDGETWEENREDDPRFDPPSLPPLTGTPGEDLRCEAANNVTGYLNSVADDLIADSASWAGLTAILGAVVAILFVILAVGSGGALSPLLIGLAGALLATGSSAFDAAMTGGVYQTFVCIVYCNTPDDGLYTEANWQAIKAAVLSELTGIASKFLHDTVNSLGIAGLNNASRTGISAGLDCDECPCDDTWCYLFDFGADDEQEWTLDTTGGYSNGTFQTTSGWRFSDFLNTTTEPDSGNRLAYVKRLLAASTITKVTMTYKFIGSSYDTNTLRALIIFMNGVDKLNITRAAMIDGDFLIAEWEGTQGGVTELSLWLRSSRDISSPYTYGGDALIRSVQIEGTGNNPFGTDNCP